MAACYSVGVLARACAFLIVIASAFAQDAAPRFEVAAIKPFRPESGAFGANPNSPAMFISRGGSLSALMQIAYGVRRDQVASGPGWAYSDNWDVEAKAAAPATLAEKKRMLQTLLADRFHLEFHREAKPAAVYALTVRKGGPKLGPKFHPAANGENAEGLRLLRIDMKQLAQVLASTIWRWSAPGTAPEELPIVDATGLAGEYMVGLPLAQTQDWPALLEDQFGLKLERRKMPVEVLVIDRAEKPAEN